MFLSGLLSGALVIFLLCHKERVLETQLSLELGLAGDLASPGGPWGPGPVEAHG